MSNVEGVRFTFCVSSIVMRKNSGFQYAQYFQHVSAGPQPIFGLAGGLRGLGAALMKHAGPPGPRGGYEMRKDLFLYLLSRVQMSKVESQRSAFFFIPNSG